MASEISERVKYLSDIEYFFNEMTEEAAQSISMWRYPAPYDIYSFTDCEAERDELMNGLHFAVYAPEIKCTDTLSTGNEPCGFAAIGWSAQIQDKKLRFIYDDESYTDIAFGLRPELCGKGLGEGFVSAAINFARNLFKDDGIRLTVDVENKRALKLYERLGFREIYLFDTTSVDTACGSTLTMKIMVLQ